MRTEQYTPTGGERTPRSGARIVAPFVGGILLLTLFAVGCCLMLAATRAYVGGESQWSKSRSLAVAHLRRFARTGEPQELIAFNAALEIPLGDQRARSALLRDRPDLGEARSGFLQGGIDGADVTGMVVMFMLFHDTPLMSEAVARWEEGDRLISELRGVAAEITKSTERHGLPAGDQFETRLRSIEAGLLGAERRFSKSLGDSSRLAVLLCSAGIALLGAGLAWTGSVFALRSIFVNHRNSELVRAANRRWALAASADGLGMIEWSPDADDISLDAQACALYGLTAQTGSGLSVRRADLRPLIHPDDQAEAQRVVENCLRTGADYKHTYRLLLADGHVRHLEVTGRFDGAGSSRPGKQALRMMGIVRDVSREVEFRRLEAEKLAGEAAERQRAQLLSRISHELRTPLHAVMGFSQLAAMAVEQQRLPERSHLAHIQTASKHLLGLVDDLLDLTSMQAGATGASHVMLDLEAVVDGSLAITGHQRTDGDIALRHERPAAPIFVFSNEQRLRQVLVNLLSNACKYNRPHGVLTVRYRCSEGRVTVDIEDQGKGMTPEQIKELFQPFRRLPGTGETPGTGLGLVIAKSAVEQVGGCIYVVSHPGMGSTFRVSLPEATPQLLANSSCR